MTGGEQRFSHGGHSLKFDINDSLQLQRGPVFTTGGTSDKLTYSRSFFFFDFSRSCFLSFFIFLTSLLEHNCFTMVC